MTEKTLTTENIKPALDALRGELAPWPVVAMKQDKLNGTQKAAINSGITSGLVAQIGANTAAIRALESAITGTGLRALVVASLPAVGTVGILYIVPVTTYDPATDADVVNYSNEYIWIVAPDAPVTQGYYEQVGQTGIVINNGQLTITVNGTSVGTFTANQSGDTTAAITVPTNSDYVDLTTAQTAAGVKTFSDGIVGNVTGTSSRATADSDGNTISSTYGKLAGSQTWTGTNSFHNLNPEANSTYSLGTSSYRWSSVYADSYYYGTTAWGLDKSNVWASTNTFIGNIVRKSTSYEIGNTPASNVSLAMNFQDKNNVSIGWVRTAVLTSGATEAELLASNKFKNGALDPTGTQTYQSIKVGIDNTGNVYHQLAGKLKQSELPFTTDTYDLGSSTYKWKTINGYEPSVLGEVYVGNEVTIDTTGWALDGSAWNTLDTSIASGWVYFAVTDCDADSFILFRRGSNKAKNPTICFHPQHANSGTYYLYALFMVPKNTPCIVAIKTGTNGVLSQKLLYPCFGNV